MLKCKDVAELSSEYLSADIPWRRKLFWHLHLFMCGPCRRFVRHFKLSTLIGGEIAKSTQAISDEQARSISAAVVESCNDQKPS